jgi:hypothetical protein
VPSNRSSHPRRFIAPKKEILIATRIPVKLNLDRRTSGNKIKHSRRSPPPTVRIRPDAKRVSRRLPVPDRPVSGRPVANAAPTSAGQSSASPDTPRDLSCTSHRRLGATARIGPPWRTKENKFLGASRPGHLGRIPFQNAPIPEWTTRGAPASLPRDCGP